MKRVTLTAIVAILTAAVTDTAFAGINYWDPNGATVTTTGTVNGTWENSLWATTATPTASTVAFTEGNLPGFVANAGNLVINATYNVTANANHTIGGIFNGGLTDGCVTNLQIKGTGTLSLGSGFQGFSTGTSGNTTVNSVLGGSGGLQWEGGGGSLYLWAANTYTGNTWLNSFNGLNFNNNNAFGTGYITNNNSSHLTVLATPPTDGGGTANGATGPLTIANDFWMDGAASSKLIFVPYSAAAPTTFSGNWHCNLASGTVSLDFRAVSSTVPGKTVISGVISGTVGYVITNANVGTGGVTFAGNNTYTGTTTIGAPSSGGTGTSNSVLQIGNGGTTGSFGTGAVTDNGVVVFNRSDIPTVANVISGSGSVILTNSTGGVTLTGANTYTGGTFITSGATLNVGNGGAGALGNGSIANNGTLAFNSTANTSISTGIVSGTGPLTKAGTGTLTLSSGANTYTGKTTITGGTLTIQSSDACLGAAPGSFVADQLTINGGTFNLGSTANCTLVPNRGITLGASGGTITVSKNLDVRGVISGTGSLTKGGASAQSLILSGANTFSGGLIIAAARVDFNNDQAAGTADITVAPTANVILSASNTSTAINIANNMSVVNNGFQIDLIAANVGAQLNLNGVISGTGALARGNNGGAGNVVLNGANTFSGGFTNVEGPTVLGNKSALGTGLFVSQPKTQSSTLSPMVSANTDLSGADAIANAVLLTNGAGGANFIINGANNLEFSGPVTLGASPIITNNNTGTTTFSGGISESVVGSGLTLDGTGTCVISGTGSYTGPTVLNKGVVSINGNISSSSSLTVNAGATLKGHGVLPAATVSGAINPGASPGTLTSTGTVSFNAGATNIVEINDFSGTAGSNPGWDLINANALALNGAMTFKVNSLNGTSSGAAANFVNSQDYDLLIVHATNGITAGDTSLITLDTTDFSANNTLGAGGFFRIAAVTNIDNSVDLVLQYRRSAVSSAVSPVSQSIVAGTTATMSVTATGSGTLSYQWYRGATALVDGDLGGRISGATSSTLQIASTLTSDSDTAYHCTVTGFNGSTSDSGSATLAVVVAPAITSPASASTAVVDSGTTQTLTIAVSDPNATTYQWKKGGVDVVNGAFDNHSTVSGATTTTLVLANVRGADSGDYTCVVQNAAGSATSFAQTLVVNDPAITQQPMASTFECSSSNALTVTAIGSTNADGVLTYQWYTPDPSGTAITDATNSFLSFPNASFANAGSYSVVVSNAFGNSITSSVVVVTIADTIAPVITVNGDAATVECHGSYTDAGATATDTCDANPNVATAGLPNVNTVGNYTVTYTATDASGNTSTATRLVTVQDTTAPTLSLLGSAEITISCGTPYTDAGATASDACAGDLTSQISVNLGGLTPANPTGGDYTITYNVQDPSGNAATAVTRIVHVIDNIPPVITVTGANPATVECHSSYTDAGATASDACAGAVTPTTSGIVDPNTVGTYTITYSATDGVNTSTATRVVNVADTTAPVITLTGNATVTNECHTAYSDPGASASDDCDTNASVSISGTVDLNTVGVYTRTYTATDASGNTSTTTRQITVSDTTAPVITVTGGDQTVECHASYTDAGATAADACDSNPSVTSSGSVDANSVGSYTITYSSTDASGNNSTATRVVTVSDSTAPVVTLTGAASVSVECHGAFSDPGATAADACDANPSVSTSGVVDANTPGVYTLTYTATDASGNTSSAIRTVAVSDTAAPIISLNGSQSMNVECHSSFTDPGATAADACEGSVNVTTTGSVDANTVADYTLTYSACDSGSHCSSATRVVHVVDTTAPVVTINGSSPMTVECHGSFTDPGATAADDCDANPNVATSGTVDANTVGSYTLTYTATDAAGNSGSATRVVTVSDTAAPVITVTGGDQTVECHGAFTDAGATAIDSCEGDLSTNITVTGTVDANTPGLYTLTYTVADSSGNNASATRAVTVQDTTAPVINLAGSDHEGACQFSTYTDSGASAFDICSGSTAVSITGTVDTSTVGDYTLTYTATDVTGNSATAVRVVSVTPCSAAITQQPQDVTVDANSAFTLSVTAVGPSLSYQWKQDGNAIVDATNSTFTVANAFRTNAGTYSVDVTASGVNTVTSSNAVVTVIDPVFTVNPTSATITIGQVTNYTFTAVAQGTPALKYQWYSIIGSNLHKLSSTTTTLNVKVAPTATGTYFCVVSNVGHVYTNTSSMATLTVYQAPKVTKPAPQTVVVGQSARFKVKGTSVSGSVVYQWGLGGGINNPFVPLTESAKYIGTTSPSLTVSDAQTTDDTANTGLSFRCQVSNLSASNVLSAPASLTVLPDTHAPVVNIIQPTDKSYLYTTNGSAVIVNGTAVDKGAIASVWLVNTNHDTVDTFTVTNVVYGVKPNGLPNPGKALWTNTVTLVDGTNTLVAYAMHEDSTAPTTAASPAHTVYLLDAAPFTVAVTGPGMVTGTSGGKLGTPAASTTLFVNFGYKITAKPQTGKQFLGWFDQNDNPYPSSPANTNKVLTFTIGDTNGLSLKANFQ